MISQFQMGLKPSLLEIYFQKSNPIPIKTTDFKTSNIKITNFEQGILTKIFRTESNKGIGKLFWLFLAKITLIRAHYVPIYRYQYYYEGSSRGRPTIRVPGRDHWTVKIDLVRLEPQL